MSEKNVIASRCNYRRLCVYIHIMKTVTRVSYIECDLGDSESVHEEDDFDMDPDDEQVVEDTVEKLLKR